jgi:hypothetical protein
MMNLHEDVILDLLPVYYAGEASQASRDIVDAYFEAHPQFAKTVRAAQMHVTHVPGNASANGGQVAIKRVKAQLKWRSMLTAAAIFFSIAPFTFIFDSDHIVYFMWRDAPLTAAFYAGAAALAWLWLLLAARRANTP